jgi:hypothetical protein
MTDTLPTQEQVDRVAQELAPDVVRIEMRRTRDHDGDPMLDFVVWLSDEAARTGNVHPTAQSARAKLTQELSLDDLEDYYAIIRVRPESAGSEYR